MPNAKSSKKLRALYATLRMYEDWFEEVKNNNPTFAKLDALNNRIKGLKQEIRNFYVGDEYDPETVLNLDCDGGIEKHNLGIPATFSKDYTMLYVLEHIVYSPSNFNCTIPGTPYTRRVKLAKLHGMWYCYHFVGIIGF